MEPEVQVHILNNLKELNENFATVKQGQNDICIRLDKIGPWIQDELKTMDSKIQQNNTDISAMQKWQAVSTWKLGTLSAGAGAVLSFVAQWAALKLGFKLSH